MSIEVIIDGAAQRLLNAFADAIDNEVDEHAELTTLDTLHAIGNALGVVAHGLSEPDAIAAAIQTVVRTALHRLSYERGENTGTGTLQ